MELVHLEVPENINIQTENVLLIKLSLTPSSPRHQDLKDLANRQVKQPPPPLVWESE